MKNPSPTKRSRTLKELDEYVEKAMKRMGGIGNNLGDAAEEYFYSALKHKKVLNGIKYDDVAKNFGGFRDLEWDIVLKNGNSVAVIEVKHKLHPEDVEEFAKQKLPLFKQTVPGFSDFHVYGGVAGMAVPKDSMKKAEEYGLSVLTQDGVNFRVLNSEGFTPKAY